MRLSVVQLAVVTLTISLPDVLAQGHSSLRRTQEEVATANHDGSVVATIAIPPQAAASIKQTALDLMLPSGLDKEEEESLEQDVSNDPNSLIQNVLGSIKTTMLDLLPQVDSMAADLIAPDRPQRLLQETIDPTPAPTPTPPFMLENGVASPVVDVPWLGFSAYTFAVSDPTNPGTVTCWTNAALIGDADLYLRWGDYPVVGRAGIHDCLSVAWLVTRERCTVEIEDDGLLYVVVLAWFPVKDLTVTCEEALVSPTPAPTPSPVETLTSGVASSVTPSIPWLRAELYTMTVSPDAISVTCQANAARTGDLDLYLRWNDVPVVGRAGVHDCLAVNWFVTRESCTVEEPEGEGVLYVLVFAWFPLRDVSVTCTEERPSMRRELTF